MLKLIGVAAIILFTTGIGAMFARELRTRHKELECLLKIIRYIESQIRYKAMSVSAIIKNMSDDGVSKDLRVMEKCKNAASGRQIADCIGKNSSSTSLKSEDIKIAQSFFNSLGKSDVEGEIENCRLHEKMLLARLDDASQQVSSKTRLYYTLGLFSGLMVSIIII